MFFYVNEVYLLCVSVREQMNLNVKRAISPLSLYPRAKT